MLEIHLDFLLDQSKDNELEGGVYKMKVIWGCGAGWG